MHKNTQEVDKIILKIAEYTHADLNLDTKVLAAAKNCLLDSLGCSMLALDIPQCKNLLGPVVPGTIVPHGARVPGTNYILDPIQATFNLSSMIRWLDFNDTWLAAEWGHPSDNIGAILSVADYISQQRTLTMQQVLIAIVKAYEIQGILALENSFNAVGLDHVILVKIASAAVATLLLGGTVDHTINAVSNAWIDGHSLRTYRHGENTGSRKSWAAGDAAARGVRLAWLALAGEQGYLNALDAKQWGFRDVLWGGKEIILAQPFDHYVIDNILFKVKYPAEFHGQTAVEAAIFLHPQIRDKLDKIERIELYTQAPAMRIINKTGALQNYADRDHCLQYMVAVGLIYGDLVAESYSDVFAHDDARIDLLRNKMLVAEDKSYSKDYLDPSKRAITNAVQVFFTDGTSTDKIVIEYPLGHKRRRNEAGPLLKSKFYCAINDNLPEKMLPKILNLWDMPVESLARLQAHDFMSIWSR